MATVFWVVLYPSFRGVLCGSVSQMDIVRAERVALAIMMCSIVYTSRGGERVMKQLKRKAHEFVTAL